MTNVNISVEKLLSIIQQLRDSNGCPWDRKQTTLSLRKYLNEEVSELLQAIDNDDPQNICEEIGDVIYVLAMISEIHREKDLFSFKDCIAEISKKLVRRHPHVFEKRIDMSAKDLREQWENIKKEEKKRNN